MSGDQTATRQPSADSMRIESDSAESRSTMTDLEEQARTLVRERPITAVLVAVGLGYVIARLVSRAVR